MVKKIFVSLGITCLISTLIGLLFAANFFIAFAAAFIIQVLTFYYLNSLNEQKVALRLLEIKNEQDRIAALQTAIIECPCTEKNKQGVEMRFDKDITFKCSKCSKMIKADVDVKSVLVTEPIYFNERA